MNTTPPSEAPSPPRAPWRLVRREQGRIIAGVATGMADSFGIDVVVMRVIWVVAAIATRGVGVAAYLICWIAFPSEENAAPLHEIRDRGRRRGPGFLVGLALLGLGFVIVFGALLPPFRHGADIAWATVLIGAGLALLFLRHPDRDDTETAGPVEMLMRQPTDVLPPEAPPAEGAETTPTGTGPTGTGPTGTGPTDTDTTETETLGDDASATSTAWAQHSPWPIPPASPPDPPARRARSPWPRPPRRPRRRSFLTPLTMSILLIGGGAAAFLDSVGAVHVTVAGVVSVGLLVVAAALLLSAWFGRARGLIPIGLLLVLVAIPATVIDVPISGGIGDRHFRPTTRAEIERNYELGIGQINLDLTGAPVANRFTTISASVGVGDISVNVPANVRVVVEAHTGAGMSDLFGHEDDGWQKDTYQVGGVNQSGRLTLDLQVGAGSIHVRRFAANGALVAG